MDLDLSKIKNVFFVGIGGIGISAIARMLLLDGKRIFGSDIAENNITHELKLLGAKITIGQDFTLIPKETELIVYTIAIGHYEPKLLEAIKNSGIPFKSYPEMLAIVTEGKYTIAVSGTHGKTTTTSMIAKILIETRHDPSVIVGSILKEQQSNLIIGRSEYFVVEACEYERSFLNIKPKILVITNIEADHLDYYKDLSEIQKAFGELVDQTDAVVICNPNDPVLAPILAEKTIKIVDYMAYLKDVPALHVLGVHNRLDAACAIAVAAVLKIDILEAQSALQKFQGAARRLEKKGTTASGVIVYDDYAHHPTEVRASLQGLREIYPKGEKKITILFQPHLYSRTKALFDEFVTCFDEADTVLLLPIYFAREAPDPEVSSEKLSAAIHAHRAGDIQAFLNFDEAEKYIESMKLGEQDVLVTMGAGEAYKIADTLLR